MKEHWIDTIDFKQMFRVKGMQGIHNLRALPAKGKMVNVQEFLTGKCKWVSKKELECLNGFKIANNDGDVLGLTEIFHNIDKNIKLIESENVSDEDALSYFVPGYYHNEFKTHHAKKTLKWYYYLERKTKNLIEA